MRLRGSASEIYSSSHDRTNLKFSHNAIRNKLSDSKIIVIDLISKENIF